MKHWKNKTRDYHQKLNGQAASQITERFNTYDPRKWGNFKAVYLSFYWLNDLWTRGFELVTLGSELVSLGFELYLADS